MVKHIKSNLIFIYLLFFLLIITISSNTIDMDYWARLLQGDAFWQLGHILKQDPFSYTNTHLWLDHEWGSSVIFSFIQNHFGFTGILFTRTIIAFLIFFFIFKTIALQEKTLNKLFFIFYSSVVVYAIPNITLSGLRCHFFTFLLFSIFVYILEFVRKSKNYKFLLLLPILMLFWVNVHGGCVSGLGLLFIYFIGELLNNKFNKNQAGYVLSNHKNYLYILLICIAVMFINPYGFDYVKFIFIATTMVRPFVTEWISAFSHPDIMFFIVFKILFVLNCLFVVLNIKTLKKDITKLLLLVVCAYLSFKYVKNTPFFIIVSMMFLYPYYQEIFNKIISIFNKKIANVIVSIFIFLIIVFSGNKAIVNFSYSFLDVQPVKVVEFIKINDLRGNVLAPFDLSSYIAYKLFPKNLIYMDGRYEEVYYNETKEMLDDFYNVNENWADILNQNLKHDYIIVPSNALLLDYLEKVADYKIVYKDNDYVLFSKLDKLKKMYYLPSNNFSYYEKNAFVKQFEYTDDIVLNGKRVIFK